MRAVQFTSHGGPEVLQWAEAPDPHAGPGQVRIAVRAVSVNAIDGKVLSGAMSGGQPLDGPGYLGYDAAGGGVAGRPAPGRTGVPRIRRGRGGGRGRGGVSRSLRGG